jgi:hypothetical protein
VRPRSSSVAPTSLKHRSGAIAVVQIAQGPECQSRDERPTHSTDSAGSSRHCTDSASRGRNMAPASQIHEIRDGKSFPDDTPHPCLGEQSPPVPICGLPKPPMRAPPPPPRKPLPPNRWVAASPGTRRALAKEHSETRGAYPSPSCLSPRGAQSDPRQAPDQQNTLCSRLANALDHLSQVLGNL